MGRTKKAVDGEWPQNAIEYITHYTGVDVGEKEFYEIMPIIKERHSKSYNRFCMHFREGLSYRECGEILGISWKVVDHSCCDTCLKFIEYLALTNHNNRGLPEIPHDAFIAGLNTRAKNRLMRNGINTVEKLEDYITNGCELLTISQIGSKTKMHIMDRLKAWECIMGTTENVQRDKIKTK